MKRVDRALLIPALAVLLVAVGIAAGLLVIGFQSYVGEQIVREEERLSAERAEILGLDHALEKGLVERDLAFDRRMQDHFPSTDLALDQQGVSLSALSEHIAHLLSQATALSEKMGAAEEASTLSQDDSHWLKNSAQAIQLDRSHARTRAALEHREAKLETSADELFQAVRAVAGITQLRDSLARRRLNRALQIDPSGPGLPGLARELGQGRAARFARLTVALSAATTELRILSLEISAEESADHLVDLRDNQIAPVIDKMDGALRELTSLSAADADLSARVAVIHKRRDAAMEQLLGRGWSSDAQHQRLITTPTGLYALRDTLLQQRRYLDQRRADVDVIASRMRDDLEALSKRFLASLAQRSSENVASVRSLNQTLLEVCAVAGLLFVLLGGTILTAIVQLQRSAGQVRMQLLESEERFRGIAENMSDWIWEIDTKGLYRYCSQNVEAALGFEPDELVGRSIYDLLAPEERERVGALFEAATRERSPIKNLEAWQLSRDGRPVCFASSASQILDESGQTVGYRGTSSDITARKQADKAREKATSELERFNRLAVGRELRMIELKREVNHLLDDSGREGKYDLHFAVDGDEYSPAGDKGQLET